MLTTLGYNILNLHLLLEANSFNFLDDWSQLIPFPVSFNCLEQFIHYF